MDAELVPTWPVAQPLTSDFVVGDAGLDPTTSTV
jgi:hypothetical protein